MTDPNIEIDTGPRDYFPVGRSIQINDPRQGYQHPASVAPGRGIGLGDIVHYLFKFTGIHALIQRRSKKTGKPCGCAARRRKLNRLRFRLPISFR